jgi:hypothetical protein
LLALLFHVSMLGVQRRLNSYRFDDAQQLAADGKIYALGTKGQAPAPAQHLVRALAAIDR